MSNEYLMQKTYFTAHLNLVTDEEDIFDEEEKVIFPVMSSEAIIDTEDLESSEDEIDELIPGISDDSSEISYSEAYGGESKETIRIDVTVLCTQQYRVSDRAVLRILFISDNDDPDYFHRLNEYLDSVDLHEENEITTIKNDLVLDHSVYFTDMFIFQNEDQFKMEYHEGKKIWALVYSRPLMSKN